MEDKLQRKFDDITEWQKRYCKQDITCDEVIDIYNEWAGVGYDEMMSSEIWGCPKIVADTLEEVHGSDDEKIRLKILDIGAGSGQCGIELKKKGFQHIDGLEPAESMLAKAKEKNVYETYINTAMTDKDLDINDGIYDVVTASGVAGYFCSKAVREMTRIVKSGGTIVIISNYEQREFHGNLEGTLKSLENEHKIVLLKREVKEGYLHKQRADVMVFKVL
ncbi:hypothetical protein CHS0354_002182 [Potamilus streckersoni]|uniref:Methyltransferase type 11 domain-containing protein n=1 Tax=Potamilus streckersoni TaxID=2493646 RepID=A0AAE0VJ42_9BIVA|nr:hypothetical protein CHS0354_002182 [Potamilus streckersoni]